MRQSRLLAVVACLAGAGLTLVALFRTWSVRVEERTGLPDLRIERDGADLQPVLVGIALVALAGAGALLATRGTARRGLGVLLAVAGAGIAVGAVLARLGAGAGAAGVTAFVWPAACVLGGAAVAAGGVLAARHGHQWAAMSSRYDRSTVPSGPAQDAAGAGPFPAAGRNGGETGDNRAFWEALDRGEDPTAR